MKSPNAKRDFKRDPDKIKELVSDLRATGMTKQAVCDQIGVPFRTMTDYANGSTRFSYPVQFALESLLAFRREICPSGHAVNGVAQSGEVR